MMRRYRKSLIAVGIIAVLFGLIITLTPFGIQYAAVRWLENDGERQAAIENVDFNPFAGELLIEGLAVTDPSGRQLNTARLFLAIEYAELFSKRVYLRAIEVQGGRVEIDFGANGTVSIAGLPTPTEPDAAVATDAPSEWLVGAGALDLERVQIKFHQEDNQETIEIRQFKVGDIAPWNENATTPVTTSLALGDAGVDVTGSVGAFGDTPSVNIKLDLKSVDLARIKKFAAGTPLQDIAGELSAALDIRFAVRTSGKLSLGITGSLGLDDIAAKVVSDDQTDARIQLKRARLTKLDASVLLNQGQPEKFEWSAGTRLDGLDLNAGKIALKNESFEWTGTLTSATDASETNSFETKGNINSTGSQFKLNDDANPMDFSIGRVTINKLVSTATLSQNGDLDIDTTLALSLDALKGTTADLTLTDEELSWDGRIGAKILASGDTTAEVEGDIETQSLEGTLTSHEQPGRTPLTFSTARIAIGKLVGEINQSKTGDLTMKTTSGIRVEGLGVTSDGTALQNETIEWNGALDANLFASGAIEVQADGNLDNNKLQLGLANEDLKVQQERATWEGKVDYRSDEPQNLTLAGNASTKGINVESTELGLRVLNLGALILDGIAIKGTDDIHVGSFMLNALETLQPLSPDASVAAEAEPYTASLGALTATDIAISDGTHTRVGSVVLDGADVQLVRQKDGEFKRVGSLLKLIGQHSNEGGEQSPQNATPMQVEIGSWVIGGKSQFSLTDQSVTPPVKVAIGPIEMRLQNINSAKPDDDVPVELTAQFSKYSSLDLKGSIKPFLPRLNVDVSGKLSGFDLTALTGYVTEHMGYDLTRGKVDTDTIIRIVDGALQTESALTINKLQVKPTDPTQLDPLKERLQLPLETALSLLQDSDEIIRLEVPITGDIANPDFDFSDAINTAIGNAMKKTVLATLKLAFPLGGIITAISDAQDQARLGVEPVVFNAASDTLADPAKAHLSKVAEFLLSRPAVKITICGWATKQDKDALIAAEMKKQPKAADKSKSAGKKIPDQKSAKDAAAAQALIQNITKTAQAALPELGKRRGEAVKDQLINQHGIAEARLFLCAPQISDKEEDKPRVALFL